MSGRGKKSDQVFSNHVSRDFFSHLDSNQEFKLLIIAGSTKNSESEKNNLKRIRYLTEKEIRYQGWRD